LSSTGTPSCRQGGLADVTIAPVRVAHATEVPAAARRLLVLSDAPTSSVPFARRIQAAGHQVSIAPLSCGRVAVRRGAVDVVLLDLRVTTRPVPAASHVQAAATLGVPVLVIGNPQLDPAGVLDAGADDVLARPLALPELLARIEAHHRRAAGVRYGDVLLDVTARRAWRGPDVLPLAYNEFTLLHALAARRGGLLTHEEAVRAIWGDGPRPGRTACYAVAFRLRHKLGGAGARVTLRSVRQMGFRLDLDRDQKFSAE
jgi:two-component system OmpR family response regulator